MVVHFDLPILYTIQVDDTHKDRDTVRVPSNDNRTDDVAVQSRQDPSVCN